MQLTWHSSNASTYLTTDLVYKEGVKDKHRLRDKCNQTRKGQQSSWTPVPKISPKASTKADPNHSFPVRGSGAENYKASRRI